MNATGDHRGGERRTPVDLSQPCEIWTGERSDQGYGRVMISGQVLYVHRVSHQLHVGPIHRGWEIDHLCHNAAFDAGLCIAGICEHRACFNPAHLESVTSAANSARGGHPLHRVNLLQVCQKGGHDLTNPDNVIVGTKGDRRCKPCTRAREREAYAARKAASK